MHHVLSHAGNELTLIYPLTLVIETLKIAKQCIYLAMLDNQISKSKIARGSQGSQLEKELLDEEDEQVLRVLSIEALSGFSI